jgi:predicted nucleic acid-binding protein
MKILLDTSVTVAGLVEAHPMHRRALPWLAKAKAGEFSFLICSHSFAEVFAVLTSLPVRNPIRPELARRLVEDNLESNIAWAARKSGANKLLNFNTGDFLRVWPNGEGIITSP